ncbi:hypothetical protein B0H14DRAFT_2567130 [Mycena olivaceomarginata]|nr:hypothetical protein B0H14DRAFT_2567130 [Mycena olivaceomarginata]
MWQKHRCGSDGQREEATKRDESEGRGRSNAAVGNFGAAIPYVIPGLAGPPKGLGSAFHDTPACTDPQQTTTRSSFRRMSGTKRPKNADQNVRGGAEKQARSDAADARLSVRATIDCDYSTVIFNETRHHNEYMRTMTDTEGWLVGVRAGMERGVVGGWWNLHPTRQSRLIKSRQAAYSDAGRVVGGVLHLTGVSLCRVACTQTVCRSQAQERETLRIW